MNYEQKYKEALEKARQFSEHPLQEDSSSIVEYIFPELQESGDEKIRKWLIDWAKAVNWSKQFTVTKEQVLAWLEKQKKEEEMVHIAECKVWPANSATTANRQLYNRAILAILSNYVEKYPDTRFGQMLYNLGISSGAENNFYVESSKMYQNINATLKEQENGKNRVI